jgi:uroporphyrin-III C-methyltransferase / precorrin-2 dehydrogenase / sirohydrochlorin ferrochelatase
MINLLPLFMNLNGRRVVLVGAGQVAAAKLTQLLAAGADVCVVAPEVHPDFERAGVSIARREFAASDLDGAWLVVAAAPPSVNRAVAVAAETRRVFVNAVDDPSNATAFLSGVVRRDGVTMAISTSGDAPGLTALLREALDAVLPRDLGAWMSEARRQRAIWRRNRVPMAERRPLLLRALNTLYERSGPELHEEGRPEKLRRERATGTARGVAQDSSVATELAAATDLGVATDLSAARDVAVDLSVPARAVDLTVPASEEAR